MKIYYSAKEPYLSQAFRRLKEGLVLTLPEGVELVNNEDQADLRIRPVVNWKDFNEPDERDVCWQLCYITAGADPDWILETRHRTSVQWWQERWGKCHAVVSYLALPTDYIRMPLGFDPNVFYPDPDVKKKYRAVTTGYVDGPGAEFITDVWKAFGNIMHVGKDFKLGEGYHNTERISDNQLRSIYQASEYVVSLRDIEGFELPLVEAAACGALPVALDLECYRKWFSPTTLFVRPDHVLEDLKEIARQPANFYPSVKRFEWTNVMKDFWKGILK